MKLSPEHRQLIRLLAEAAVEQFLEEQRQDDDSSTERNSDGAPRKAQ